MRILREAEGMRKRGHTVAFGIMTGGILAQKAREKGFEVRELNFHRAGWLWSLFQLLKMMRGVDLVITHSSLDAWIGGIAARIAAKKIIRMRHLSTAVKPGWNSRMVYGRLADFVVTTCNAIIEPIAEQSGKDRKLFRSVPTGIEPFTTASEKKEKFSVGTACFMRSWKGIEVFLKAADLLRDKNIHWIIIGGGHDAKYRQLAKEVGLEIEFTGHLENPFPKIASLDVFALLSTANEGVSQALLQAAYLGKPLIATPTGGSPEVCLDGKTGIVVPVFDEKAVAKAVLQLLEDQELRDKMGQAAHLHVSNHFTFEKTLDEMEQVMEIVCTT